MNKRKQVFRYLLSDFISASVAWTIFYIFRKEIIEPLKFGYDIPLTFSNRFFLGLLILPAFWLLYYYLTGFYKNIFRHSRTDDLFRTFMQSISGVLIIFFILILDDEIKTYRNYYLLFSVLLALHFFLTLIPRLILTSQSVKKVHNRKIGFNTLIIGSNHLAYEIFQELTETESSSGNKFVGFISLQKQDSYNLSEYIPKLGSLKNLIQVIENHHIEEVIIALESSEHDQISHIINQLGLCNVIIKAIPDMYDILTGKVKMDHLFGTPLIQLSKDLMPVWQANLKQLIDISVSVITLIVLSPLIIILAIGVKLSSKGPALYSHE